MYTIEYRTKYDAFCFTPFIPDLINAKVLYLKYLWWGCKAVRIVKDFDNIIWETPDPTPELPF